MAYRVAQRLNVITVVLVLTLFGTVCRSYAIDCMDIWDEESIAEMVEDRKRYQESLRNRRFGDDDQDDEDDDVEDDEHDSDDEHDEHDEHDQLAEHDEQDEDDEAEEEHHQGGVPETTAPAASSSHQDQRHKRQLALDADQRPVPVEAGANPSDDLEVAETHLFRPVFRYKSQYTERRRVRDNFTPPRQ